MTPAPDPEPPTAADAPPRWADPAPDRPVPFWDALRRDVRAHVPPERRGMSRWAWARTTAGVVLRSPGFHAVLLYRLAHALRGRAGPPGRLAAGVLSWLVRHAYACTISPAARLHGGLILPHPQGIVIGPGAVVGPRAWIYQNVTLGGAPGKVGLPTVGGDARLYAGCVLAGPIALGDNVLVGANAVVARDVPDRTAVRAPAAELAPLPEWFLSSGE